MITNKDKNKAFEQIQKTNPARDNYHIHIRSAEEVHTLAEVAEASDASDFFELYPADTFNEETLKEAVKSGIITVYHGNNSKAAGCFVSTSEGDAAIYAGYNGRGCWMYRATIPEELIAWISAGEGIALNPIKWEKYYFNKIM